MALDFSELLDRASRSHWLSCLAGSLVALRGAPGATWKQRAFNVFSGLVCACASPEVKSLPETKL